MPSPRQRIQPLPPDSWTDAAREVFALAEGPEARERGARTNATLTLANHPELATAVFTFHKAIARICSFPLRLRELVILKVAWERRTQFAWGQHVRIGREAGLGDADFHAIRTGGEGAGWSEVERLAVRAAGELCATNRIADATWDGLAAHLSRTELMELIYLIGQYELNCWMFNAIRTEIEPELVDPAMPEA
jgi:alkylhydroperoxidase family enzyme